MWREWKQWQFIMTIPEKIMPGIINSITFLDETKIVERTTETIK
jgi:hypothetical protein